MANSNALNNDCYVRGVNSTTLATPFSSIDSQDIIVVCGDTITVTGTAGAGGIGNGSTRLTESSAMTEFTELNELSEVPKIAVFMIRSDAATQDTTIPGSVIESSNMDSINGGSDNSRNKEKHEKMKYMKFLKL